MKKYLFLYAVAVTALLVYGYGRYRRENRRLTQNQHALAAGIERYRTRLGQEGGIGAGPASALRRIRRAAGRRRRRNPPARNQTPPSGSRGPDSHGHEGRDTHPGARYGRRAAARHARRPRHPAAVPLARRVGACRRRRHRRLGPMPRGEHRHPAAGRTPHSAAFSLIRWGTKALRQEIVPSNPHTRIVYSEYVKIER